MQGKDLFQGILSLLLLQDGHCQQHLTVFVTKLSKANLPLLLVALSPIHLLIHR